MLKGNHDYWWETLTKLNKFRDEKIDILLGTQMITKGHDFENVTLVGVLAADASINVGDYNIPKIL